MPCNTPLNPHDFPRLELVFDLQKGELEKAEFRESIGSHANHKFCESPSNSLFVRELCILIVLAKYRGPNSPRPDDEIEFKEKSDRSSWLKALGVSFSKETHKAFFQKSFGEVDFALARRGDAHNKGRKKGSTPVYSSAKFFPEKLRLKNIVISKVVGSGKNRKEIELKSSALPKLAAKLEQAANDAEHKWEPAVMEMVARIDGGRPIKSETAPENILPESNQEIQPFLLSGRWLELDRAVRKAAESGMRGGNWYVLCVTPSWLVNWKEIWFKSVAEHGAKIKFAYHSPEAGCPSVKAQWRMNISPGVDTKIDPADDTRRRLELHRELLGSWASEADIEAQQKGLPKGGFQFYESYIAHPFTAILSIPPQGRKFSNQTPHAPDGTRCMLLLHPFYPASVDDRCGLYLNRPSPMLNIYYNSVLSFFEQGPKDNYLKPVDLRRPDSDKIER